MRVSIHYHKNSLGKEWVRSRYEEIVIYALAFNVAKNRIVSNIIDTYFLLIPNLGHFQWMGPAVAGFSNNYGRSKKMASKVLMVAQSSHKKIQVLTSSHFYSWAIFNFLHSLHKREKSKLQIGAKIDSSCIKSTLLITKISNLIILDQNCGSLFSNRAQNQKSWIEQEISELGY